MCAGTAVTACHAAAQQFLHNCLCPNTSSVSVIPLSSQARGSSIAYELRSVIMDSKDDVKQLHRSGGKMKTRDGSSVGLNLLQVSVDACIYF